MNIQTKDVKNALLNGVRLRIPPMFYQEEVWDAEAGRLDRIATGMDTRCLHAPWSKLFLVVSCNGYFTEIFLFLLFVWGGFSVQRPSGRSCMAYVKRLGPQTLRAGHPSLSSSRTFLQC